MFKFYNKDTTKTSIVVLVSSIFHTFSYCFYRWPWSGKSWLSIFVSGVYLYISLLFSICYKKLFKIILSWQVSVQVIKVSRKDTKTTLLDFALVFSLLLYARTCRKCSKSFPWKCRSITLKVTPVLTNENCFIKISMKNYP